MRADARENLDRILAAAARLFAQDGADTSLKAIALEADVGIATLYRRFPTRADLDETERLVKAQGRRFMPVVADIRDLRALRKAADDVAAQMGRSTSWWPTPASSSSSRSWR